MANFSFRYDPTESTLAGPPPAHVAESQKTDAVIAAVKVMNRLQGPTADIMGAGDLAPAIASMDAELKATAQQIFLHREAIGPIRTIRFALFVDDWLRFRNALCTAQALLDVGKQRLPEMQHRARGWSHEIARAVATPTRSRFPWRKIFVGAGIGAGVMGGFLVWRFFTKKDAHGHSHQSPSPQASA